MKVDKHKIIAYSLSILSIVLILYFSYRYRANNYWISMLLIGLSNVIIFISFVYEDSLKIKVANSEKKLSGLGKYVAVLLFVSIGANLLGTHQQIVASEHQSNNIDTITDNSKVTIEALKSKRKEDSLHIDELKSTIASLNDSISTIKDNQWYIAIKTIEEEQKRIEAEKENIFKHFKKEIENNLYKIVIQLNDKTLDDYKDDPNYFTSVRLENTYTDEYSMISGREDIIDYLMELSECVEKINFYAESILKKRNLKDKAIHINAMKGNVKRARKYLSNIYSYTEDLNSYSEYESMDFYRVLVWTDSGIDSIFRIDFLRKHSEELIDFFNQEGTKN